MSLYALPAIIMMGIVVLIFGVVCWSCGINQGRREIREQHRRWMKSVNQS